jgi:hypothetical protein
VAAFSGY